MLKIAHIFWVIALVPCQKIAAEYMPFKKDQIGEYYEYDIEGSPRDQLFKKYRRRSKKILFTPLGISRQGLGLGRKGLKKISHAVEIYLSGHKQNNINKALSDWEGALSFDPGEKSKSAPGLLYAPREIWRLLKYSLYLAGFRLPREVMKKIKDLVYGTCGFVPQK